MPKAYLFFLFIAFVGTEFEFGLGYGSVLCVYITYRHTHTPQMKKLVC